MRTLANPLAPQRRGWRLLAAMLLCMAATLVQAQSATDDDSVDPPSRVARLSYISGDLGFLPAGATDWSDASVNRPLTTGDRLSTSQGARAELEFGDGSLRMDGQTDFGLLDLNDQLTQIELTQGTLNVTVRHMDQGQSYEIDTPTVALVIDQAGTFRVDINDDDGSTQVTAFDGDANVYGENNAQRTINAGRSYRFVDSSLAAVVINDIGSGDAFDAWSSERDHRYVQSDSSQYVSDDVVGAQDLDQYGDWQDTGDYGEVWYPTQVAADWAPYRDGHWAYIAPWGWTWVDDSPWGFAPYHYGRWAYTYRGWGWIPGRRGVRSIYAPALVAFVGGGGWSAGIGGGPVGWFPLGPGEIYNPWYRCGRSCYTNVNLRNMRGRRGDDRRVDINDHYNHYRNGTQMRGEHYANRDAPRGFTAVPGNTFAGGRHVQRNLVHVDQRQLAAAPMLSRDANKLRPIADGTRPSRSTHARHLPAGGFNREVVARHAPPMQAQGTRGSVRGGNPTGSPRADMTGVNVHVLNPRGDRDRGARALPANRSGNDRIISDDSRRPSDSPQQLPAVSRITAGTPAEGRNDNRAEARDTNGLPSSRFAHPRGRDHVDQHGSMPRAGVSYISGANQNQPRPAYRNNPTLPQVPQIQRATPANDDRYQRYQNSHAMRRDASPEPVVRSAPEQRFQRAEPAPRNDHREQPQPMQVPTRPEPVQPTFQQPRYQQPQRAMPQPRAETSRPQRGESRPAQKSMPRARDDSRQH